MNDIGKIFKYWKYIRLTKTEISIKKWNEISENIIFHKICIKQQTKLLKKNYTNGNLKIKEWIYMCDDDMKMKY